MNRKKLPIPRLLEFIFDIMYLLIVVVLGIYFIITAKESTTKLWGIMAMVLASGDACHLIPRILSVLTKDTESFRFSMGIGKMLTSITMTIFYLLLWQCGLILFSEKLLVHTSIIYLLAAIRIILCLFPQNKWTKPDPNYIWGIYRNIPFVLQGCMVMWLFARYSSATYPALQPMYVAIFLSFAFYLPVVLFAHKHPKLGMLMLPKSCTYIWIICMLLP